MTKAIIFFLLISMPSLLIAQESQFTLEQLDKFDKSKIIINVYELDGDERNIIEPYPEARQWQAYQGKKRISEREFYLITGHEFESEKLSRYKTGGNLMVLSFPILFIGGNVLGIILLKNNPEGNAVEFYINVFSTLISLYNLAEGIDRAKKIGLPIQRQQ